MSQRHGCASDPHRPRSLRTCWDALPWPNKCPKICCSIFSHLWQSCKLSQLTADWQQSAESHRAVQLNDSLHGLTTECHKGFVWMDVVVVLLEAAWRVIFWLFVIWSEFFWASEGQNTRKTVGMKKNKTAEQQAASAVAMTSTLAIKIAIKFDCNGLQSNVIRPSSACTATEVRKCSGRWKCSRWKQNHGSRHQCQIHATKWEHFDITWNVHVTIGQDWFSHDAKWWWIHLTHHSFNDTQTSRCEQMCNWNAAIVLFVNDGAALLDQCAPDQKLFTQSSSWLSATTMCAVDLFVQSCCVVQRRQEWKRIPMFILFASLDSGATQRSLGHVNTKERWTGFGFHCWFMDLLLLLCFLGGVKCNTLICLQLAVHRASSHGTHRVVTHSQKMRFSAHRTSCC